MLALLLHLAAAGDAAPAEAVQPTIVNDRAALARLRRNSGVTLQWISWDYRGHVRIGETDGRVRLTGSQVERGGPGRLTLDGDVIEIDRDSFRFAGRIAIRDAPGAGRYCVRDGVHEFRITGRRRYWRLQEMEVCDGLTDYVDIYF